MRWSVWNSGASIASWRFIPRSTWRMNACSAHCSCWSPPGVPHARYGSPSRSARPGQSVVRGRVPGRSDDGEPLLEPEHLRARPERPAERGDDRRALQPAAARRRRDHVPEAIGDVEVHGAAARLARAERRLGRAQRREAAEPRPVVGRGVVADERAPLVVVLRREQRLERDVLRVAVQRVAVGERELSALDDDVDELGGRELGEIEALRGARAAGARPGRPPTAASCRP